MGIPTLYSNDSQIASGYFIQRRASLGALTSRRLLGRVFFYHIAVVDFPDRAAPYDEGRVQDL